MAPAIDPVSGKVKAVARALVWLRSALVAGLLLAALALGFLAADGNRHGMVAFAAGALAAGSHVRRGSGRDFLAVVLLIAAVGLGLMVQGGGTGGRLHLAIALPAALLSTLLPLGRWRTPARATDAPTTETGGQYASRP